MNVTTTVKINKNIKSKAARKAKKDNLSLNAVIAILLKDYANDYLSLGSRKNNLTENGLTEEEEEEILKASMDAKKGINFSGPFDNIK